jgi:hypothetical protein
MIAFRTLKVGFAALAAMLAAATLSGCTDARRALGYDKAPPDEFAVVSRAPLSQPPDFSLRPPAPGAPRPQEGTAADQARGALTPGKTVPNTTDHSAGEKVLLAKSGADKAPADIRRKVNEETTAMVEADNSFVDKLLFWTDKTPPGDVVDAAAESKRIKDNAAAGKPASSGNDVKIEQKDKGLLPKIF